MKPDVLELLTFLRGIAGDFDGEGMATESDKLRQAADALERLSRSRSEGPIGYAVLHDHDGWLGCWRSLEVAEDVRSKGKKAVIYPVYAALSEPSAGMVMVPREPTATMVVAFNEALDGRRAWINQIEDGLRAAMLAAAPPETEK